ncbi:sodium channel subunit beta-4-like [Scomber japonicus]|uniref:sodium channel subunit beta-4-like n=1 Tax=Scomber japonicus TaxID=13676 RepID=UPI002306D131|nr:sodium channel subunit beta-4-like [Scomber japonicus]
MASVDSTGLIVSRRLRSGDLLHAGLAIVLLLGVWSVGGLEVSTGKVSSIEAINGSTVLLPCKYSSCIGIKNLHFIWGYNANGTIMKVCEGVIRGESRDATREPRPYIYHERVEFVGSSTSNNISILLWNITFEDEGEYICFARNPKEKNREYNATFTLIVVDQLREVDNTLTVTIVSVLGGVIGLVITVMVIKAMVVHTVSEECLVRSGNDDTQNGPSGTKSDKR